MYICLGFMLSTHIHIHINIVCMCVCGVMHTYTYTYIYSSRIMLTLTLKDGCNGNNNNALTCVKTYFLQRLTTVAHALFASVRVSVWVWLFLTIYLSAAWRKSLQPKYLFVCVCACCCCDSCGMSSLNICLSKLIMNCKFQSNLWHLFSVSRKFGIRGCNFTLGFAINWESLRALTQVMCNSEMLWVFSQ